MAYRIWLAYILWFFFGLVGAHHLYLRRYRHAFATIWTFGGGTIGWFVDGFKMQSYVDLANQIEGCEVAGRAGDHGGANEGDVIYDDTGRDPLSLKKIAGELLLSLVLGLIIAACVPSEFNKYRLPMAVLITLAVALGVHIVANIGKERASFICCLQIPLIPSALYSLVNLTGEFRVDDILVMLCLCSTIGANRGRGNKVITRRRSKLCTRAGELVVFGMACGVMLSIIMAGLYFNATITSSDGEKVMLKDAIKHMMDSPAWIELKATLSSLWYQLWTQGFTEFFRHLTTALDVEGEQNAYRVLNVTSNATDKEIQSVYRKLAVKYHPDKIHTNSEVERREVETRWMEITEAYERLSTIKRRRKTRNEL